MPEFSGSSLVVTWLQGSGTNLLTGNQRNFSYTPSIDLIDVTAGADANKNYISGVKDGQAQFEALFQGTSSAGGTAIFTTCAEGNSGTLKWSPLGTAAGQPLYTMPAISMGASFGYPYSDAVTVSVPFQQNGARTEGTN